MGWPQRLHGADFDVALDVWRHGCEQSDHTQGQGAPDKLILHFQCLTFANAIFQIRTANLL